MKKLNNSSIHIISQAIILPIRKHNKEIAWCKINNDKQGIIYHSNLIKELENTETRLQTGKQLENSQYVNLVDVITYTMQYHLNEIGTQFIISMATTLVELYNYHNQK